MDEITREAIVEVENMIETVLSVCDTVSRIEVLRSYCKTRKAEIENARIRYYGDQNDEALAYAVSQLPEDERNNYAVKPVEEPKRPEPKIMPRIAEKEGFRVCLCGKCSGTGIYAMEIRNGQPWSLTGTTCYPCNGSGWVYRKARK